VSSRPNPNQPGLSCTPTATEIATTRYVVADPNLAAVVDAWPELPQAIRTGILAMVNAAKWWGLDNGEINLLGAPTRRIVSPSLCAAPSTLKSCTRCESSGAPTSHEGEKSESGHPCSAS